MKRVLEEGERERITLKCFSVEVSAQESEKGWIEIIHDNEKIDFAFFPFSVDNN